ncbi:MAG: 4-hydroxy-tetrahydrodipicolinate synthase [Firmicutes bacterium]|nr:4-hydroxy-tetrahydrodipicolinate synthase [Bacillota bacterium]
MVTPFDDELSVDYDRAAELAEWLVENGSDGIVVAGTTGESPTLTEEEMLNLFQVVADAVGDRTMVIAGTGSNSTARSVELTRKAARTGIHGIMAVVPYYNRPTQEGLALHFKEVAACTDLPVILYNVPGRTGTNLLPSTVARMADVSNITAVKEASGNLDQVSEIRRLVPDTFLIYAGDDNLTLPILAVGGCGVISVASHLVGREMKQMVECFQAGKTGEARRIHLRLLPLFKALFAVTNPILAKKSLALAGFPVGGLRPPLIEPGAGTSEVASLREVMASLGVLG